MGLGKKEIQSAMKKWLSLDMLAFPMASRPGDRSSSASYDSLTDDEGVAARGMGDRGVSTSCDNLCVPEKVTSHSVRGKNNGNGYDTLCVAEGVASLMMSLSLPGHEHPFAVQAAHNRHLEGYIGEQKPLQLEFFIKRKPVAQQGDGEREGGREEGGEGGREGEREREREGNREGRREGGGGREEGQRKEEERGEMSKWGVGVRRGRNGERHGAQQASFSAPTQLSPKALGSNARLERLAS